MMSTDAEFDVPADLVAAAIRAARDCGRQVADVPLTVIAQTAGISRSTLLRRMGGSRRALDDAVRRAGVDPGGQPVRQRAIEAGAQLIGNRGLATVTLEMVAETACCSMPSLHTIFGTRDQLFAAIYERYSPLTELTSLFTDPTASFEETVASFYESMVAGLTREPQVAPAMFADLLASPHGPAAQIFSEYFPRALSSVGGWLEQQAREGRIRDISTPLLIEQLIGPLVAHVLLGRAAVQMRWEITDLRHVSTVFTAAFLQAVAIPGNHGRSRPEHPTRPATANGEQKASK
jgi:AcrR family transcriptional regulator